MTAIAMRKGADIMQDSKKEGHLCTLTSFSDSVFAIILIVSDADTNAAAEVSSTSLKAAINEGSRELGCLSIGCEIAG